MLALTSPGKCAGGYVAHDFIFLLIIEESLEVKEKRKSQKKADADARKGRKVAKHFFSRERLSAGFFQ